MAAKQCKANTKKGSRCPNAAGASGYCFTHDPSRRAERVEARKRGGRARHAPRVSGDAPVTIGAAADVLALVNAVIADAWRLDNTTGRARVLLAAGDSALRALDVGEFEARIAALEEKMAKADALKAT